MEEAKEKELYQIARWYESKAIPIDWNKVPEEIISDISSDLLYDHLSYSEKGGISKKTVLYFKKVKKFRKDITKKYETPNMIFGI